MTQADEQMQQCVAIGKEIAQMLAKKGLSYGDAKWVLRCAQAEIENFKLTASPELEQCR